MTSELEQAIEKYRKHVEAVDNYNTRQSPYCRWPESSLSDAMDLGAQTHDEELILHAAVSPITYSPEPPTEPGGIGGSTQSDQRLLLSK